MTDAAAQQVATVRQQVQAIGRGDFDTVLAQASPDVELDIYAPPEFPFVRCATGATYHVEFVHRFTFDGAALRNVRVMVARAG